MLTLKTAVGALARLYRPPKPLTDPLQIIVWENIGYLIPDETRAELFAEFGKTVGFDAKAMASAQQSVLAQIATRGGLQPGQRVQRWREIARLILVEAGGDLKRTLKSLPLPKARALLKKFPAIGEPGADKVLLFSGVAAVPTLESNGLRTLVRLGFAREEKSYGATYKGAARALAEGAPDRKWLMTAYAALREHGKTLCKRSKPLCLACPLDKECAHTVVAHL